MNIKFLDLKKNIEKIKNELAEATHKVIQNTSFIIGEQLIDFENNFPRYYNINLNI